MCKYFPLFLIFSVLTFAEGIETAISPPPKVENITKEEPSQEVRDVVVLGGGVGGLTSALYLSRAGLHPLVITGQQPGGALAQSPLVQNWPGELGIDGGELVEKIRDQAVKSGAEINISEVICVDFSKHPFTITIKDPLNIGKEKKIFTKSCIIATGSNPNMLNIPGEQKYWLHGVHNCAVCDGNFYKGDNIVVVGGSDGAIIEAHYLAKFAKKVTLIVRGPVLKTIEAARKEQLLKMPNVDVLYNTTVKEIRGNGKKVTELLLYDKEKNEEKIFSADALFLAIGNTPNTKIFKDKLDLDEKGFIILRDNQQSSVPGIFAVGDVCDAEYRQAVTAAGDGAKAALQAEKLLALSPKKVESKKKEQKEGPAIIAIKSLEQFEKEILRSETPVIVDFYADWCGPCRALEPRIQSWSKHFDGKIKFAKVNIDHLSKLAQRYNIRGVPTVLYFDKGGILVNSCTGMPEISNLMEELGTN